MNYYKDAEDLLNKYRTADVTLENLNKRLEKLKMLGKPKEINAINFDAIKGGSGSKDAIQLFAEVQHVMKQIQKLEDDKENIKNVLKNIKVQNKVCYDFLKARYLDNKTLEDVSEIIGYSSNSKASLYGLKDKALGMFIRFYWGE